MIESEFPSLRRLWACGFERPPNFDELEGQALREWVLVSELPDELLKANAVLRPAIHPAHPSLENIGHIVRFHRQHKMETPLLYLAATFGYLPLLQDHGTPVYRETVRGKLVPSNKPLGPVYGHPWLLHEGARLALDVADRQHVASFVLWRVSVIRDFSTDRQTPIVKAPDRRVPAEAVH